jgi:hypothetical protein
MRGPREERIESVVDRVAAIVFAAAVGFSAFSFVQDRLTPAQLFACVGAAVLSAFVMTVRFLRGIRAKPPAFELRTFQFPEFGFDDPEELLLTDQVELVLTEADRLRQKVDELVLDDILARLGPDSRVVRLFDPAAMPTPGQLNARIEQHLRSDEPPAAPSTDASEALHQALSELRRSLR